MSKKLMGKKLGMSRVYDDKGNIVVCTVIEMEPNVIVQTKNQESDGYSAVQIGSLKVPSNKKKNITKPVLGHFAKAKIEPRRHLQESRVEESSKYQIGQEIGVEYFSEAKYVDATAVSKGKGYQGVMKRHNFRGGPASHGSGFHRSAGSTGMRSTPGRNLPGGKKAGQMGSKRVTVENLKVVLVNAEKKILLVKGAVPGPTNGLVTIKKALKKPVNAE